MRSTIQIVSKLLSYGLYCPRTGSLDSIEAPLVSLLELVLGLMHCEKREKQLHTNLLLDNICAAKLECCMICESVLDTRIERRIELLFNTFQDMFQDSPPLISNESSIDWKNEKMHGKLKDINKDLFSSDGAGLDHLLGSFDDQDSEFINILIGLVQYDNAKLVAKSFSLMYQHFSQRERLITR